MMRCLWSLLVLCAFFCVSPVSAQTLLSEEIKEDSVTGQDVVEKAKEFIGVPYRYGQMNPKRGFDCSAATCSKGIWCFSPVRVPRRPSGMWVS